MGTNQSGGVTQSAIHSNTKTDYISSSESINSHRGPYVIESSRDEVNATDINR